MSIRRSLSAGICSFVGSLVLVLYSVRVFEGRGSLDTVIGIYAVGLALGAALGRPFGHGHLFSIGVGAFLSVGTLWAPVVLVTYGFALAAVPLLVVYSLLVVLGAWLLRGTAKSNVAA